MDSKGFAAQQNKRQDRKIATPEVSTNHTSAALADQHSIPDTNESTQGEAARQHSEDQELQIYQETLQDDGQQHGDGSDFGDSIPAEDDCAIEPNNEELTKASEDAPGHLDTEVKDGGKSKSVRVFSIHSQLTYLPGIVRRLQ